MEPVRRPQRQSITVMRILRVVGGFLLLIAGLAMILLPGPGWLTVALGLALLAPEFPWAHNALTRLKRAGNKGADLSREALAWLRQRFGRAS